MCSLHRLLALAVVFAGQTTKAVLASAESARQAIAGTSFRFAGRELFVTASGGIAEIQTGDQEKEIIRRADEALYSSKKAGRNCGHYNDGRANHRIRPETIAPAPKNPIPATTP